MHGEQASIVAEDIERHGGRALAVEMDVGDEEHWADSIDIAVKTFGGLDVLVNNAGIGDHGTIDSESCDEYRRIISVTQDSVFLGMQAAAEPLKRSNHASVVNRSSILGLTGMTKSRRPPTLTAGD